MCNKKTANTTNIEGLLENNRAWAAETLKENHSFFTHIAQKHAPKYLWIGCSDARVSPNILTKTPLGEMFVHRNVGNVVNLCDVNVQTVLNYAIKFLRVEHVIISGHYNCGAIQATLCEEQHPDMKPWLSHINKIKQQNHNELNMLKQKHGDKQVQYRLSELNVMAQVENVEKSRAVVEARKEGQPLRIYGWVYNMETGILKDLKCGTDTL